MGDLIDLNSQIPDNRIPSGIARDTETTAAINAHLGATDPHPIYLTQAEGDARYRQSAVALIDGDIPTTIARDAETTAAINAHLGATDPHPIYLTQAEGDGRYRQTVTKLISDQVSASTQGGSVSIPHGLDINKILAVTGRIEITGGQMVFSNSPMPNGEFYVWAAASQIIVANVAGASFFLLSKPLTLLITYIP